jgi:hypothetical protein
MKAAEILRKLADMIDTHSDQEGRPTNSVPHAELAPVEVDNTDNTETTVMVAPLQQKLDLLKQAVQGSEETCPECGANPCGCETDELDVIKQNAGIPKAAVIELSDDEPFEG